MIETEQAEQHSIILYTFFVDELKQKAQMTEVFVCCNLPTAISNMYIMQYLRVVYLNEEAPSVPSDSMAVIIMPVISLLPSGTVLLLFNTSVLAYILYQIPLFLSLEI